MANNETPDYKCKQTELYAGARLGWESCRENLDAPEGQPRGMKEYKDIYTEEYIGQKLDEIEAAEALPTEEERSEKHQVARRNLEKHGIVCANLWQDLKEYIKTAYRNDETILQAKLEAAGSEIYQKAAGGNWEQLTALMAQAMRFLDANRADLSANRNMPAPFPDTFNQAKTDLEPLYKAFKDFEQGAKQATGRKIRANNKLYADLIDMLTDGQKCFRGNQALKDRFVFDKILALVRGSESIERTFIIEPAESKTARRTLRNAKLKNAGPVAVTVCPGSSPCTNGTIVEPNTEFQLPGDESMDILTITNNAAEKATVKVRVMIH